MRCDPLGSRRHSSTFRAITTAPGISPPAERCSIGRVSTTSAPSASALATSSAQRACSGPRAAARRSSALIATRAIRTVTTGPDPSTTATPRPSGSSFSSPVICGVELVVLLGRELRVHRVDHGLELGAVDVERHTAIALSAGCRPLSSWSITKSGSITLLPVKSRPTWMSPSFSALTVIGPARGRAS